MHRFSIQSLMALILSVSLVGATLPVGLMTGSGSFTIDNSRIAGNATLFEGNTVETGATSSQLRLNNGARMQLAAGSRGIVYRDRLVLERGVGQVENGQNYQVEALSLRIRLESGQGSARVAVLGPHLVHVAAVNGPVRVSKADGLLLAKLAAGREVDLQPEAAGASAPSSMTGCLAGVGGKLTLADEASGVSFEMKGTGLESEIGHRLQVTGTMDPASHGTLVRVTTFKVLAKKCSDRTPAAAGAAGAGAAGAGAAGAGAAGAGGAGAGAAGAATAAGIGIATKAVIAGVVIAGAGTGAAVAVVKQGDSTPPSTISPSSP